jgi:hypothetical protein
MSGDPLPDLARLIEELRNHRDIEIDMEWGNFAPPVDDPSALYDLLWQMNQDIAARVAPGCVLDPALRPLVNRLAATADFKAGLAWRYRLDGDERNGGEFCWQMPLSPPDSAPAWWGDLPAEVRELHTRLCVLEYHPRTGDSVSVMLELRSGADSAPLWLERRGELHPMTIGITEYIERTVETRGLFGWQVLFCDWQDPADRALLELAVDRHGFEHLQRLFPDIDYQPYLQRYDHMWLSMA